MRTLVISDLHGNLPALEAVLQTPHDQVICLGDLVDYGPWPAEVVDRVRALAALAVRGNHDDAIARGVPCACAPAVKALSDATQALTRARLGEDALRFLASLPIRLERTLFGQRLLLCHATPEDPLFTYLRPSEVEAWRRQVEALEVDGVLVGHTHLPMHLTFGRTWVLNPGSVGQPRDGDPRAAFAVIEDGVPRLERVAYDVERTVGALRETGLAQVHRDRLIQLLRTGTP